MIGFLEKSVKLTEHTGIKNPVRQLTTDAVRGDPF
jgi:hypothetical protein